MTIPTVSLAVKPQTTNWAETVSDEEDNDSEDEGDKKRPRQQYENLDDNAFSYTGSISASEETTLVENRFSMVSSDDAARTANRGPEWVRTVRSMYVCMHAWIYGCMYE